MHDVCASLRSCSRQPISNRSRGGWTPTGLRIVVSGTAELSWWNSSGAMESHRDAARMIAQVMEPLESHERDNLTSESFDDGADYTPADLRLEGCITR
jgi:hypothetical protein